MGQGLWGREADCSSPDSQVSTEGMRDWELSSSPNLRKAAASANRELIRAVSAIICLKKDHPQQAGLQKTTTTPTSNAASQGREAERPNELCISFRERR